jgi:UDP-N-acetylglucosamine 2-epimerase (non-hydrolysing)
MRRETERPEAVEAGVVRLVGPVRGTILAEVSRLLDDPDAYADMAKGISPYGDGHASARIVDILGRDLVG